MENLKKKVFISTGGFKNHSVFQSIKILKNYKIFDIELSGGKPTTKKDLQKLIELSKKINLRPHNYFPPPRKKFVINLASTNKKILSQSLIQIKKSIVLTKKMNAKYFSFHAGFRIDPSPEKLGKKLDKDILTDKDKALKNFKKSLLKIYKFSTNHNVKILIENNVITNKNLRQFKKNPLLLTHPNEILKFFKNLPKDIGLLLDVGHLKVSSKTLNFDLKKSFYKLKKITKGYHLSDNDFIEDQNNFFDHNSWFYKYLNKDLDFYSIEVYSKNIKRLFQLKNNLEKKINKF